MVELINTKSEHDPLYMVIDVPEEKAERLLANGDYDYKNEQEEAITPKEKPQVSEKKPDMSWTEKEIKAWIKENNIPVKYSIATEKKADKLQELQDAGYL